MIKALYWLAASIAMLILRTVVYYILNYHHTAEGAMEELEKKTDGHILTLPDNTLTFLIEEDGRVSVASSYVFYPFGWYKDFEIHPTALNVYDINEEREIPYAHAPKTEGLTFGLIKNERVEYLVPSEFNMKLQDQNATKVFHLEEELNDPELKQVKLWYSFLLVEGSAMNELFFLDKNKEVLSVERELIQK
ncbi:hypothetical protein F9802_03255 [Bacillus aerolatus]|uniref:Uncharacterized protein n=1 Tax=Bacillus aerolatus TaxID=2653354 RepID=A0A6I1FK98_9BACI|nr:hypothetical protein [Bacillus aerolatus]KAB7709139.1 hypothetical protein F9802_03255 [Bacillus aerolatus]